MVNKDMVNKVRGRLGNREDIWVKVSCIGERIASPQDKAPKTFTEWADRVLIANLVIP